MSTPTVLVLPLPAQGHVNPLMNLSEKLVEHGCKVIFVNTDFIHKRVVSSMAEQDGLHGSQIKLVSIPDGLTPDDDRTDLSKLCSAMLSTMPAVLEKLIEDIHSNSDRRISCIVVDVTMGWMLEVGHKLGIKGAVFWSSSAALFALTYNIPKLIDDGIIDSEGFPITEKTFQISPSMPMMDTRALFWSNFRDYSTNNTKIFNYLVHCIQTFDLTDWWLCNTTYELEPDALSIVSKLLPIGPLLRSYNNASETRSMGQFWEEDFSCMSWLDQQPHSSVLYVAFGSFTLLDQYQFTELALGLELTNRPFLWVVRQDPNSKNKMVFPNEFKGSHGKIVGWAPQQKVLSHPAIACFVSHCGWNSTMEGLSNGIPFLCWPYFGDQLYDMMCICDELKVGMRFDSDENGLVSRLEIEKKVDQLLSNANIRLRSVELKKMLLNNLAEGGRSLNNFSRFIKWLKG